MSGFNGKRWVQDFTDEQRRAGAATRIGHTPAEYEAHRAAGEKWCSRGRHWVARARFGAVRTNHDGLDAMCRDCKRAYQRRAYHQRKRIAA